MSQIVTRLRFPFSSADQMKTKPHTIPAFVGFVTVIIGIILLVLYLAWWAWLFMITGIVFLLLASLFYPSEEP